MDKTHPKFIMKKILSIILSLMLIASLVSCSNNTATTSSSESTQATSQNVKVEDATKPHTNQLNNDIFSIKPDDSFIGAFDTVVEPNYIELYDLESRKNGFEGLLFAICAFTNPNDWAGSPSEKVGELKLNDGTIYDIIIGYPTESQFGFDREMPATYKKLYDARYDIAKTVTGKNGEQISIDTGVKGDNLYNSVLDKLLKGLNENWDANRFEKEDMSSMYKVIKDNNNNYLETILYAYHDINMDGIEELLIGEKEDITDSNGKSTGSRLVIYDVYTMVDRKPAHVISGWGRSRYYAVNSSFLANEYSDSAFSSGLTVYALETNSTKLIFQLALKYDESEDEKAPWYISYTQVGDDYDWDKISEDDYNSMYSRFDTSETFDYNTLKSYQ